MPDLTLAAFLMAAGSLAVVCWQAARSLPSRVLLTAQDAMATAVDAHALVKSLTADVESAEQRYDQAERARKSAASKVSKIERQVVAEGPDPSDRNAVVQFYRNRLTSHISDSGG
ncbi:MAG: hypothetical protein V3T07_09745 [Myxococcota bacterium]